MATDMERALDEILSGVNDLLAKAPLAKTSIPRLSRRPAIEEDWGALLCALAYIESEASHPAGPLARRLMVRALEHRAVPLGAMSSEFSHVTVSPMMWRGLKRLKDAGAGLIDCVGSLTYWDCSMLPHEVLGLSLGRLWQAALLDASHGKKRVGLPRIPERMSVQSATNVPISSLDNPDRVVLADQDNSLSKRATIFWLENAKLVPDELLGAAILDGRMHLLCRSQSPS